MLELKEIAKEFERGLNAQLNDPDIRFRIWTNAGERTKPLRTGNGVKYAIDGELKGTASENIGAIIDMGMWMLSLTLGIPIPPPRTVAVPKEGSLARIDDEQYAFLVKVTDAVNDYFAVAESLEMTSEGGKRYSVGIRAGSSIPGLADFLPALGESLTMNVSIQFGYVEGGVNSRSAKIAIDTPENILPTLSAEISRSNVLENDVYAGKYNRQSVASASALVIALQLPLTVHTGQLKDFLVRGDINIAHFVFYTLDGVQTVYWMMADEPQQASKEVSNIGLNCNLIEVADDPDIMNVPDSYQVAAFTFGKGWTPGDFVFRSTAECYAKIGRSICLLKAGEMRIPLDYPDVCYDEDKGQYTVYIATNRETHLTYISGQYEFGIGIVKRVKNG